MINLAAFELLQFQYPQPGSHDPTYCNMYITYMTLAVYCYDFICMGIVVVAIIGALVVLGRQEGMGRGRKGFTLSEGDLQAGDDEGGWRGYVGDVQLWMSCWRGLHPGWLLVLRFVFAALLAGVLAWDVKRYDGGIFIYYTE